MTRRRAFLAAGLAGLGTVAGVGCANPAASMYFLFRGDEKVPAEHPLVPKGEQKEVTVAILTSTSGSLPMDFAGVDRELGALVGKAMAETTKEDKHPVRVVDPAKVTLEAHLYTDLEIDSIDTIDLILRLKEITGRKIQPDQFRHVRTVGDAVSAIHALLQQKSAAA